MSRSLQGRHLLLAGPGYVARAVAAEFRARGGSVTALARSLPDPGMPGFSGIRVLQWDQADAVDLNMITDLLVSTPPDPNGCPTLARLGAVATAGNWHWIVCGCPLFGK